MYCCITGESKPKKHPAPMLSSQDKQGSAIDLGLGPPLEPDQLENYKRIQQVWHGGGVSKIL